MRASVASGNFRKRFPLLLNLGRSPTKPHPSIRSATRQRANQSRIVRFGVVAFRTGVPVKYGARMA